MTNSFLVITAQGADQPNLVSQVTDNIVNCGGNIVTSRMSSLGKEFGLMLLVSGSWDAIAKIESIIPKLAKQLKLQVAANRSTEVKNKKTIKYNIHAIALDRKGILNELAKFFSCYEIKLLDVNVATYHVNQNSKMVNLNLLIEIDASTHLPTLRDKFMHYCDTLNLDASMEPHRD